MKLEKHIIDRKINVMKAEGIEFVTDANIGVNIKAQKLQEEYDAVVLCCGASNPRDINAPGRDANGIYFAVDFLTSTTKSLLDSGLQDGNTFLQRIKMSLLSAAVIPVMTVWERVSVTAVNLLHSLK